MANYPHGRHRGPAPRPPGPPASMRTAARLMYAGAGIAVILGVSIVLTLHSTPHTANAGSGAYKAGRIAGGAISGLIVGGLWLWMAWANNRGRSWARIVSTVLFGLLSLEAAASLLGPLPVALRIVATLEWAAGLAAIVSLWQRQSSEYYKVMSERPGYSPMPYGPPGQQYGQQAYAQQPSDPSHYGQPPLYHQAPQHPYDQPHFGQPGHGRPPHGRPRA
jgi:hypothetical protein